MVRFKVNRRTTKGILERGHIVGLQHDQLHRADRVEQLGDIPQRNRIKGFGLPVLAGVRRIGDTGRDPRRAECSKGSDKPPKMRARRA